ncbi:MAG: alpha/beta fold hydrolase [Acidobacteria bacterium]|nr:alpha/beta fold hydrolase [Acidobacteriota bacterium]
MQATIGDRRVGYDSFGSGIPLLLIHAFPLNRTMYAEQNKELAKGARVVSFDAPGVGNSESAEVSIDGLADLAVGLMDALHIQTAVVGGVSMGGYAALAFARLYPDRLRGLILADTRAAADSPEGRKGRQEMADVALNEGSAAIAERMIPRVLGATTLKRRRKIVDRVRGMIESTPPEAIAALSLALGGRCDSTALLSDIRVPTLVVTGEEDALTPASEAREWGGKIRHAKIVEIPDAGHLANIETPDRFNSIVREFLEGLPPSR